MNEGTEIGIDFGPTDAVVNATDSATRKAVSEVTYGAVTSVLVDTYKAVDMALYQRDMGHD